MTQLDLMSWRVADLHHLQDCAVPAVSTGDHPKPKQSRSVKSKTASPDDPRVAAPVLRWVGSKRRLLPALLARVPVHTRYFEPFCGGAALYFALASRGAGGACGRGSCGSRVLGRHSATTGTSAAAVLNDANPDLMACYRALAGDVEAVIRRLQHQAEAHDASHYAAVRREWNAVPADRWDSADRAAAFLYLNRTSFNGLWRVNRAGEMNTPIGRTASGELYACDVDAEGLRLAGAALARAVLRTGDYREALADAAAGDFVYLDSPYDVEPGATGFTAYTSGPFGVEQQRELAASARDLVDRSVRVMLSNADTALVRSLYAWARIDRVSRPGTMSSKATGRQHVGEVIVIGGYEPRGEAAITEED